MHKNTHNPEYQAIIFNTIFKALEAHSRLFVIRCDLRFPQMLTCSESDSQTITRFISSLKAKIAADIKRKEKSWGRNLTCTLNYVWVREYGDVNGRKHYHVLLFLNKDVYHSLGDYQSTNANLSLMIKSAWLSAIRVDHPDFYSLVHFGSYFYLDRNKGEINFKIQEVMKCADYLAKNVTKRYGDGERSIGSSL